MTLADLPLVALLGVLVAGPWGVVLIVALVRGYDLTVTLTRREPRPRRRRRDTRQDDDEEER